MWGNLPLYPSYLKQQQQRQTSGQFGTVGVKTVFHDSISDFSGGIRGERVRTRVVSKAMLNYRVVDVFLQSSGVSVILFCFLGVDIIGIIFFTFLCLVVGIMAELFALNLSLTYLQFVLNCLYLSFVCP